MPAQPLFCGATDQLTSSVSPSVAYQRGRGYQEAVRAGSSEESHEDAHSAGAVPAAAPRRKKTGDTRDLTGDNTPHLYPASPPPPGAAQRKKIFAKGIKQRTEPLQLYSSIRWLNAQSTSILKLPLLPTTRTTQAPNLLPCPAVPAVSLHPTP